MNGKFDGKSTDIKKQEKDRRTELAMLGLLIEKYPKEAQAKMQKSLHKPKYEKDCNHRWHQL